MTRHDLMSVVLERPLPETFAPLAFLVGGPFNATSEEALTPSAEPVDEAVKAAVRSLLRWGGHKPSGRGRPASESLAKAVEDGRWPTIHPLVDACNLLSLRSGLPISVLDSALLRGPMRLRLGREGEDYVFNPSGQSLSLKGLLLIADADGPTGSPVKDAQRSKISSETSEFLIVVWGTDAVTEPALVVEQGLHDWCRQRQAPVSKVAICL